MSLWKKMRTRRLKRDITDALSPQSMLVRVVVAGGLLISGFISLNKVCASDILFIALPIIAGGIILGPVICQLAATPFGYLFWPKLRAADAPVYSTATACRYRGRYDEAISHYRQILDDFPDAFQAHADLIEMTALDMDNIELSRRFLLQSDRMVEDESKRNHLRQIFAEAERRYNAIHTPPEAFKPRYLESASSDTHSSVPADGSHVNTKPEGLL